MGITVQRKDAKIQRRQSDHQQCAPITTFIQPENKLTSASLR